MILSSFALWYEGDTVRTIGLAAALLAIPFLDALAQSAHSARAGDVQVTVVATRIASSQDIKDYGLHPRADYKVVLVFLRVKNVARYPSCSYLDEWLHVKQGYEYPKSFGSKTRTPKTHNLLPTDESSGEFAFEIKAGTEPSSLRLVRNEMGESMCATLQHRDTRISGSESVSLSLVGLPAKTEESVAQVQPPALPPTPPDLNPPDFSKAPPAVEKQKLEVEEQQSNVIPMKDGFEYKLLDYGVGRIQVRNQGTSKDFTQQVFWVEFQITNRSEHLIGNPHHFPSVLDALQVKDNWGNVYSLRYPNFTDLGGNWFGVELPIPGGSERREQYKPGESSWAVRLISPEKFVSQVKDLRIYLANQSDYPKLCFKIDEPLTRRHELLRHQPEPAELSVKVVTERRVPHN